MKFTEKELTEIKEELNKQVLLLFNATTKTIPNIKFDVVEDDDILEDKAANFRIKNEDLPEDFNELLLICTRMNSQFLSHQVIPFVDETILENAPKDDIEGLYSVYMSPKYYSEVQDEFNFDNNVMNTIMVPVTRLPKNKEHIEIALNCIFNVEISYKVVQEQFGENEDDINILIRVKVGKGVIKND